MYKYVPIQFLYYVIKKPDFFLSHFHNTMTEHYNMVLRKKQI